MEDRLEELAVVGFDFDETVGFDDVREGFLHLAFNLAGEVAEFVFLAEVDVVNGDVPFSGNVLGIAAADLDVGVVGGRVEFFRCFKLPKWNVFSLKLERGLLAPPSGFIPRKVLASKLGGCLDQRSP